MHQTPTSNTFDSDIKQIHRYLSLSHHHQQHI